MSNGLSAAQVEQRRQARTTHGAYVERQISPVAARHRRNVLRQLRLRVADLDPIGRGYLDAYVRLRAKVETIDAYIDEHGLIGADGEPQPVMRLYVALQNSARLSLQRLEQHLDAHGDLLDPLVVLEAEGRRLRLAAEDAGGGSPVDHGPDDPGPLPGE